MKVNGCRQSSTCKKSVISVIYCTAFETKRLFSLALTGSIKYRNGYISEGKKRHHDVNIKDHIDPKFKKMFCANVLLKFKDFLTLFLPGEGGISPLIVCHVTKSVRNRVKP